MKGTAGCPLIPAERSKIGGKVIMITIPKLIKKST